MCLLYNYGQVTYFMKEQLLPVKIRCDVELWRGVVCVERRSNRVTVNWWTLEIAPFRTRTRYIISGCLHLRHLQTHEHIIYLWKALFIPWQWSTQPNHQMMYYTSSEGQIRSSSTYICIQILLCVCQCKQCNIVCHWKTHCILVKWVIT